MRVHSPWEGGMENVRPTHCVVVEWQYDLRPSSSSTTYTRYDPRAVRNMPCTGPIYIVPLLEGGGYCKEICFIITTLGNDEHGASSHCCCVEKNGASFVFPFIFWPNKNKHFCNLKSILKMEKWGEKKCARKKNSIFFFFFKISEKKVQLFRLFFFFFFFLFF